MSKLAFLFPGQGRQAVGMGKVLFDSLPTARAIFDQANQLVGYDLAEVCFNGPELRLNSTAVSQPAIFVCSLAALESLKQSDPTAAESCSATAGLSLGEYTALVFAGAMTFADGLRVVQSRGEAMQAAADATPSSMLSILGMELPKIGELVAKVSESDRLWIANLLGPGNIVVSGTKSACDAAERLAGEMGAMKTIRLAVAGAFHTEIMRPADQQLEQALVQIEIRVPRIPVWSNVDAKPHTDPAEIRSLLVRQVLQSVRWEETMRGMLADGYDKFHEIGPGRVLAGLLKRIQRKVDCVNIQA